jgi:hypothetical protein
MGSRLFNLLMVLRQAKDFIVSAGPGTMYKVADTLARLSDAARQVGQIIDQYGPQINFAPGRAAVPVDPETQKYTQELQALQQEMEQHAKNLESAPERQAQAGESADPEAQMVNPMTWILVAQMMARLIKDVLDRTNQAQAQAQTPAPPQVAGQAQVEAVTQDTGEPQGRKRR